MSETKGGTVASACPECDIGPFKRNHYFTGKLLVERDFIDEQRYFMDKQRLHNQQLHGSGVVCGLRVVAHDNAECQHKYVCIEPGLAIDCCGREIRLLEEECIDITQYEAVQTLIREQNAADPDGSDAPLKHVLQICIKYRECPTESIPILYDECGCDDTQCAPNRILESYSIDILVDPDLSDDDGSDEPCCAAMWKSEEGCPSCASNDNNADCLVLATIIDYTPGQSIEESHIDNRSHRQLLSSTQTLSDIIRCLCEREPGGGGSGIDDVQITIVACDQPGSAAVQMIADQRVLVLEVPRGCDGSNGQDGENGQDGVGLELDLTRINRLSWRHSLPAVGLADIKRNNGEVVQGFIIGFTGVVVTTRIDHDHVFQVAIKNRTRENNIPVFCRCYLEGEVIPVTNLQDNAFDVIGFADESVSPADGIAFIPQRQVIDNLFKLDDLFITLRGDFITDISNRAIDAEFVRGSLPTGDRAQGSSYGIQGGTFESWFRLDRSATETGTVPVNSADVTLIANLPRVTRTLANRIVENRPFRNDDDLLKLRGVSKTLIDEIRNLINFD